MREMSHPVTYSTDSKLKQFSTYYDLLRFKRLKLFLHHRKLKLVSHCSENKFHKAIENHCARLTKNNLLARDRFSTTSNCIDEDNVRGQNSVHALQDVNVHGFLPQFNVSININCRTGF